MLESLAITTTHLIDKASYLGIVILMTIESCNLPLPSELIMPFAGFLVSEGKMNFWIASLSGAIGCTIGSLISYWLGALSERSWIKSWLQGWGRMIITPKELQSAERWMRRYGSAITFFSRLFPIIRGYISFPAGIARIPLSKFITFTFLGSFIWCIMLTYVGVTLGRHWDQLSAYFHQFDLFIIAAFIIGIVWVVWQRAKHLKKVTAE
jgi:membrane protein DedA with SNARE-associated domain